MSKITPMPVVPAPAPLPAGGHRAWYQRPAVILPLALVTLAAVGAALFLVLAPSGITARGTVIDRLTGQPVAAASLHGGGKSATTDAHGKFQIAGVAAGTALRVHARYYAPAQVKAAQAPVTVRLAPVPVPVAVTSALTGGPLTATLVTPTGDRAQTRADGTATLYRMSPGQTVAVTAAGYLPRPAGVGADHTVKAVLSPTQRTLGTQLRKWDRTRHYQPIIDWTLRPATGYTFMGTSPHAWARDNKQMAGDSQTAYIGGGYTADGTGATIQIAWPGAHWDPAGMARLLPGAPMHPVTLAGQRAWHGGPDSNQVFTAMWSYGPALVTVTGTNGQHQVDAVMTGIIKAMISPPQGS